MKTYLNRFMELVTNLMINMKKNIFQSARIKLTAYYVSIMLVILVIFSSVLIYTIELKLRETLSDRIIATEVEEDPIENANNAIEIIIYSIDGALLLIIAFASYLLSGKTLKPIKNSLDAQKKFSADASHDLRTPLAIIITESEVALQGNTNNQKDFKEVVKSNLEEAKKMSGLVNDLLIISRGENENTINNFVISDLYNFIEKIMTKMAPQAESKGLKLKTDEYKKILVKIDLNNFERAISNILQNAIHYTKKGSIQISLKEESKKVLITIKDTGVGINEHDLPNVFDRFYKAEHSRNDESGSGLGLPIAKQIIEQHQGNINIKSQKNIGTEVDVSIPKK